MAYQRQRLSCQRADVHIHQYMHEGLSRDEQTESGYCYFREYRITEADYHASSGHDAQIQYHDEGPAEYQAEFLDEEREDIVAVYRIYGVFLGAVARAFSQYPSFLDGQFRAFRLAYPVDGVPVVIAPDVFFAAECLDGGDTVLFFYGPVFLIEGDSAYGHSDTRHEFPVRGEVDADEKSYDADACQQCTEDLAFRHSAYEHDHEHQQSGEQCAGNPSLEHACGGDDDRQVDIDEPFPHGLFQECQFRGQYCQDLRELERVFTVGFYRPGEVHDHGYLYDFEYVYLQATYLQRPGRPVHRDGLEPGDQTEKED